MGLHRGWDCIGKGSLVGGMKFVGTGHAGFPKCHKGE